MKKSTKLKDINIKLTKDEFIKLGEFRDAFLLVSIIWTLISCYVVSTHINPLKLFVDCVLLILFWSITIFTNCVMVKVKRYKKSLFIRPSLEYEEDLHKIK